MESEQEKHPILSIDKDINKINSLEDIKQHKGLKNAKDWN